MKSIGTILAFGFAVAFGSLSHAGEYDAQNNIGDIGFLRMARQMEIYISIIDDGVEGGCWNTVPESITAAELEFIRSGFNIVERSGPYLPILIIRSDGGVVQGDLCVVNIQFHLHITADEYFADAGNIITSSSQKTLYLDNSLVSGLVVGMGQLMIDRIASMSRALLVEISKRQQELLESIRIVAGEEVADYWKAYMQGDSK